MPYLNVDSIPVFSSGDGMESEFRNPSCTVIICLSRTLSSLKITAPIFHIASLQYAVNPYHLIMTPVTLMMTRCPLYVPS
jgi:hypothetical protein